MRSDVVLSSGGCKNVNDSSMTYSSCWVVNVSKGQRETEFFWWKRPQFFSSRGRCVDFCVCVCVIVTGVTHTQEHTGPFLPQAQQNFLGCVCWNRVPLYARRVCLTNPCTQAGALIRTSDRAGAAHTGVNQHAGRSQRSFDSFLCLGPMGQQTATVPKKSCVYYCYM